MKHIITFVVGWYVGVWTLHYFIKYTDWGEEVYYPTFVNTITKENDDEEPVIRAFGY